jgi:hypothetical protein
MLLLIDVLSAVCKALKIDGFYSNVLRERP